ncbi:MAG: hypothetical protein RIR17_594, partial [Planctomycetota bacterium]
MRMILLLAMIAIVHPSLAAEPETVKLWPEGAPSKMVPKSEATTKLI